MRIGDTLLRDLAKLVMRAAGDQAKTACGNLQLCEGLWAGIESATYTVGQKKLEKERQIRRAEEVRRIEEDED